MWGQPRRAPDPMGISALAAAVPVSMAPVPSILGNAPQQPPMAAPMATAVAAKPKKEGVNWLGVLGDALAGAAGGSPMYMQTMLRQREQDRQDEREAAERLRRRNEPYRMQNNRGDAIEVDPATGQARTLYSDPNQKPQATYRWEANDGSLMELGADGTPNVVYKDPTPKLMTVYNPSTGNYEAVPVNGAPTQQAPPQVLDTLPPGAKPLTAGGPTGSRSGTFR